MSEPLKRTAKGKRPQYFSDPATDKLMSMVLVLAEELSVTRDRLDAMERRLQEVGNLDENSLDDFVPDANAIAAREAQREIFVARLLRPLQDELDGLTKEQQSFDEQSLRAALE